MASATCPDLDPSSGFRTHSQLDVTRRAAQIVAFQRLIILQRVMPRCSHQSASHPSRTSAALKAIAWNMATTAGANGLEEPNSGVHWLGPRNACSLERSHQPAWISSGTGTGMRQVHHQDLARPPSLPQDRRTRVLFSGSLGALPTTPRSHALTSTICTPLKRHPSASPRRDNVVHHV